MRRSRHKTLEFIEIISIIAVILFVLLYFTGLISCVPQNVKDTNQEVQNNSENIDGLNDRVDTVDEEVTALRKELDKTRTEFMFSINQLYIADEQFQNDKAIIENYLNTLSTKEELNSAISNIENGIVDGDYVSAVMHANVFRGKNLGNEFTESQLSAIRDGTFNDLFVGDYWNINGVKYRIADINYYLNTEKNSSGDIFTEQHILVVPDNALYNSYMNETDTFASGYINSYMYTTGLAEAKTTIQEDFNNNLISFRCMFSYSVDNNGGSYEDYRSPMVALMNEIMINGTNLSTKNGANGNDKQLSLFRLKPSYKGGNISYWTSDGYSSIRAVFYNTMVQRVSYGKPSEELGVRPYFCIG